MFDASPPRVRFIGLRYHDLTASDAASAVAARARAGGPFAYVATPNVDHLVRLERERDLIALYQQAWLCVCDSKVLAGLARLSGLSLTAAPGADIAEALLARHIRADDTIAIVGGTRETADALAWRYGLHGIRWFDAPHNLRRDPEARAACVDFLLRERCRFVFLAVGSPQQELIAHEAAAAGLDTGVALCCGSALAFLSGETARAPRWMREAGLEWLFRLAAEPRRLWRRYLLEGPRILTLWLRWRISVA